MENSLTDNEVIAQFMGYQYFPYKDEEKGWLHGWMKPQVKRQGGAIAYKVQHDLVLARRKNDLKYHNNWSWLVPVVQKIDQVYSLCRSYSEYLDEYQKVEDALTNNYSITETHKAVVEFINWYNKQKESHEQAI